MSQPLLTIAIPAYNVSSTIIPALQSIARHRTYHLVEVLVVNDGSTDDTATVCSDFIQRHAKANTIIRLITQKNRGHGSVINRTARIATGKYYRILDGDDAVDPAALDQLLRYLATTDDDLIITNYVEHNLSTNANKIISWSRRQDFSSASLPAVIQFTKGVLLPFTTVKTSILSSLRLTERCYYDDQEFNLFVTIHAKTVSYLRTAVYIYNIGNDQQSISNAGFIKHHRDHERIVRSLLASYASAESIDPRLLIYIREHIIIPICHHQYYISTHFCHSRQAFLSFDRILRAYPEFYHHPGIAGRRIRLHRLTHGLFVI